MSTGQIPAGWTRVKFGDVVRKVSDRVDPETSGIKRFVAGEHMDTDDLQIRRWGEVGDGYLGPAFHMRFKPGQVLYGSRRTYLRKVAVADFEGITANTTFVLESSSKDLMPEFLPFVMTTEAFHEHSIKQSKGSVNPYINFSDLTWYEFALPPLDEQQRIAKLMKQASLISERIACIEPALLLQSVAAQMWSISESTVALGMIVDRIDVRHPRSRGEEIPTVLLEDMEKSSLEQTRFGSARRVSGPLTECQVNDILFGKLRPNLRKVALAKFDGACGSEVVVLRCKEPNHVFALLSVLVSEAFYRNTVSFFKGTKMPRINPADLLRCPVPQPTAQWSDLGGVISTTLQLMASTTRHADKLKLVHDDLRESLFGGQAHV